ncbi:Piso0_004912 [Millerozyma farinosa CBS 7064]|uniref:Piso0_004912 protein n=1 Tax=Pichia sorbitophila (strain ATCC MYA-4447 / BCRC 22081 / CBS 7064 / NBRC 10061 / NRRL Y-12695) TaxID=559304 RepID=G8Y3Q6_PICSO|nr:Piso0_004912 [Millerozyma farinosa CBS 7064]
MSSKTLAGIPSHITHVLKIFNKVSNAKVSLADDRVRNYLIESSSDYRNAIRDKILTCMRKGLPYKPNELAPYINDNLQALFSGDINSDPLENISTRSIFDLKDKKDLIQEDQTQITSTQNRSIKKYTDHQANLIRSFSSYYSPLRKVPNEQSFTNSFKWYVRLLEKTPVVFFLKVTNRLFSDYSIAELNKPVSDFREELSKLQKKHISDVSSKTKSTRSYYFTELLNPDLFSLAIKGQSAFKGTADFERALSSLSWEELNNQRDALCDILSSKREIKLVNRQLEPVNVDPRQFVRELPLKDLFLQLDSLSVNEVLPYDIIYDDLYILTIESSIIDQNHDVVMKLLEAYRADLQLIAVRLSLDSPAIIDFLNSQKPSSGVPKKHFKSSYEELLSIAKTNHMANSDDKHYKFANVMKKIGELGLHRVNYGTSNNCIYISGR